MAEKEKTQSQQKGFSVALGLIDYINPVCYSVNTFLILSGLKAAMNMPQLAVYIVGLIISLVVGLIIPTGKLLVGLGKIEFRLPFILFLLVNLGILITGSAIFSTIVSVKTLIIVLVGIFAVLGLLWAATKKFNSAVLFTGTFGYTLIYLSLVLMAIGQGLILPAVLFVLCFAIMIGLILFSMKADLTNPHLHWYIEGANIACQIILTVGLIILF